MKKLNENTKITLTLKQLRNLVRESREVDPRTSAAIDNFVNIAEARPDITEVREVESDIDEKSFTAFDVKYDNGVIGRFEILNPNEVIYYFKTAEGKHLLGVTDSTQEFKPEYNLDLTLQIKNTIDNLLNRKLHKLKIERGKLRAKLGRSYGSSTSSFITNFEIDQCDKKIAATEARINFLSGYLK